MEAVGQVAFYRQIAQMDQRYTDEVQDSYVRLRCPILLLWAPTTSGFPSRRAASWRGCSRDARLIEILNCGHLMQEDAPEAIVAAALKFFR